MNAQDAELDQMQGAYKAAVEQWIAAIRKEETLASVSRTMAQVDTWEQASFDEEDARKRAKAAKAKYEAALREKFFHF
jgi:hypothetical protein